jgi:Ca2+-binding RTX toxin-like protein
MMRRTILLVATMALTLLVASGVALAITRIGTDGPDTLKGTNGDDNLIGMGGNDELFSLRGDDNLLGGPGKDVVAGNNGRGGPLGGEKNLIGGSGNDLVFGGSGSDNEVGNEGNDFLNDGELDHAVRDNLSSGAGNDVMDTVNYPAVKDVLACGTGFDRVVVDRKDVVAADCERAKVVHGSLDEVIRQENAFFRTVPESFFEGLP